MSPSITISNGLKSTTVGKLGYGLMNFTWKPVTVPDERAFPAIKAAIDSGSTFINAGEFYNRPEEPGANLKLLARFFKAYPGYADKVFLSVKGATNLENLHPDCSSENLRGSVDRILAHLDGTKKLDLFQPARIDRSRSIEDIVKDLKGLIEEGKFDHIGLSEVSAATLKRAQAVYPISLVEAEYSVWSQDIENNGLLEACKELKIPIVGYSPLGRGMLAGALKSASDVPKGDIRSYFDRFQPENFDHNLQLVHQLSALAAKKNVSLPQLCLAWALRQEWVLPIPGSTRPEGVLENVGALKVTITEDEDKDIRKCAADAAVKGGRYNAHIESSLFV
ncbi:Aldo/keto reductase [Atractiella rhizophila]|nr:Aldo/keto reductase [Atractiella rhizophila]